MAKLAWNAFVKKHTTGIGIRTATYNFPKLKQFSKDGRVLPSPVGLLVEALKSKINGDWAHASKTFKDKGNTYVVVNFIFAQQSDALIAANLLQASMNKTVSNPPSPFKILHGSKEFEPKDYEKLAATLGYS